jgi:hypothetical protein
MGLDPAACRRQVYDYFDVPDMVDGYLAVYRRAIARAAAAAVSAA